MVVSKKNQVKKIKFASPVSTTIKEKKKHPTVATVLKDHLVFCCNEISISGLSYLVKNGITYIEKLFWFIVVAFAATFGVMQGLEVWDHYNIRPVIIHLESDYINWNITFPTITLCQTGLETKFLKSAIQEYGRKDINYTETEFKNYITKLAFDDYTKYYKYKDYAEGKEIEYLKPEHYLPVLDAVVVKLPNKKINKRISKTSYPFNLDLPEYPVYRLFSEVGVCSVFNPLASIYYTPNYFNNSKPYNDYFEWLYEYSTNLVRYQTREINHDYKVFVHSNEEVVDIEDKPIFISKVTFTTVRFTTDVVTSDDKIKPLRFDQRNCRFIHEHVNMAHSPIYSFKLCRMECRIKLCLKYCNCTPYYYRRLPGEPICNMTGMYCLSKYNNILVTLTENKKSLCTQCLQHCNFQRLLLTSTGQKSILFDTNLIVTSDGFPFLRYKRVLIFTQVDLIVQIGGIVGLFLGSSILSLIEIIYFITLRFYWGVIERLI